MYPGCTACSSQPNPLLYAVGLVSLYNDHSVGNIPAMVTTVQLHILYSSRRCCLSKRSWYWHKTGTADGLSCLCTHRSLHQEHRRIETCKHQSQKCHWCSRCCSAHRWLKVAKTETRILGGSYLYFLLSKPCLERLMSPSLTILAVNEHWIGKPAFVEVPCPLDSHCIVRRIRERYFITPIVLEENCE